MVMRDGLHVWDSLLWPSCGCLNGDGLLVDHDVAEFLCGWFWFMVL